MKISVVIPCRNEVKHISECVSAIFASVLSPGTALSVYVVDGMSDDGTRELVLELMHEYPGLALVDNVKQLTPFAFNLGIYQQKADYIQIVGARQVLSANYLQKCIDILSADQQIWCVGGNVENVYLNETGRIISVAMSTAFGMGLGNFRTLNESGFTDTVGTPMYPYWVFEKIGFFDEELIRNQDDDFNFRVTQAGGKIYFEASIYVKYYVRGNFSGLYRQFYQYGYWKVFVNRKHKAVTTMRQLVPPAFVLFIFLFPFTILLSKWLFFPMLAIFGIYLLMALYFSVKKGKGLSESAGIFKTFPILHFSYGAGYLKGILDFIILGTKPSDKQKRLSR